MGLIFSKVNLFKESRWNTFLRILILLLALSVSINFAGNINKTNEVINVNGGDSIWVYYLNEYALSNVAVRYIEISMKYLLNAGSNSESVNSLVIDSTSRNIFIIFSYAVFIWLLTHGKKREEQMQWADSVYFLGFALTLVALIFALGGLSENTTDVGSINQVASNAPPKQSDKTLFLIVQNAIALSSTLIALIIRTVWRLSLRIEAHREESSVEELTQSFIELGDAIRSTTRASGGLQTSIKKLESRIESTNFDTSILDTLLKDTITILENRSKEIERSTSKSTGLYDKALQELIIKTRQKLQDK